MSSDRVYKGALSLLDRKSSKRNRLRSLRSNTTVRWISFGHSIRSANGISSNFLLVRYLHVFLRCAQGIAFLGPVSGLLPAFRNGMIIRFAYSRCAVRVPVILSHGGGFAGSTLGDVRASHLCKKRISAERKANGATAPRHQRDSREGWVS
jgi:hypothetical protein